jgi:uncharacterized SAM-binding protein YcdF (DUF218 family)
LKALRRITVAFVTLPVLLFGLEAGYFIRMLSHESELGKADLIVAFEGRDDRAAQAYRLLELSYAQNLVISPATERTLQVYEKRYVPSQPFRRIVEDQSRTTLENAVYTKRILEDHDFRSAILVTSWDHMPRSYFLLKVMIHGSDVSIHPLMVATGRMDGTNWYRYKMGWKMVYNEMVEFWGSMIELAKYRLAGDLPAEAPGKSSLAGRLKQFLLFDVDPHTVEG